MFAVAAAVLLATVGAPLALVASAGSVGTAVATIDGSIAVPVTQATANDSATTGTAGNDSVASSEIFPGQYLSAAIGVQGSEINGGFERRSFDARFANANSNASKATVVVTQVEAVRERLAELEQCRDRLKARRENGTLSEGQYHAQLTRTVVDIERTRNMLNQTTDAASTVLAQELLTRGVETAELDRLRTNASELTGPEVAEIARGVAENSGKGIGCKRVANEMEIDAGGRPDDPGRSDIPGNLHSEASDRAADARADAGNTTNGTETNGHATNGTVTDVAGGESDEAVDGADRGNASEMSSGNDKRVKDADGSGVAVSPADERSDDDMTVTDDDTIAIDDDTVDDESETSFTDDSGA